MTVCRVTNVTHTYTCTFFRMITIQEERENKVKSMTFVCCRVKKDDTEPLPCKNPGVQCCGLDLSLPIDLIMCTAADSLDLCLDS